MHPGDDQVGQALQELLHIFFDDSALIAAGQGKALASRLIAQAHPDPFEVNGHRLSKLIKGAVAVGLESDPSIEAVTFWTRLRMGLNHARSEPRASAGAVASTP